MSNNTEQILVKIIEERFSELFHPAICIPKYVLKSELDRSLKPTKQTVEEITQEYNRNHEVPISRVRANTLLNELEAENEKIQIERENGKKYIFRVD